MSKPRIYHYDTTYEQEAEDGTVTASVELRIYFTVTDSGKPTRDDPGWPAQAEFHSIEVEVGTTKKYAGLETLEQWEACVLREWAEAFVDDHQDALLIRAGEDDEANADYAREMRDEMRREVP